MWIYKRKDSGCWWVGYRLNGRQYLRSTKTADRKEAEKLMATLGMMEGAKRNGSLTEEFFQLLTGNTIAAVPLKSAMDGWLTECQGANAANTVHGYRVTTTAFLEFMHASDTAPTLGQIGAEDVRSFLTNHRKTRTAATCNTTRKILSTFFLREVKMGRIKSNPVMAVKPFKAGPLEKTARRAFTLKEIKNMHAKAPDDFWRFAILAGFYTGLRLGDLICLPWGAVDFNAGFIRTVMRKTHKTVAIPMAAPVRAMLRNLYVKAHKPQPNDFVWPTEAKLYQEQGSSPFSAQFYEEMLLPLGLVPARDYQKQDRKAGPFRLSEVSFHCLRHSFVSALKLSGGSQSVAKELAGHGSDMMNDLYTHTPEKVLTAAIKALPEVTR